jgi:hypothetical protein
MSPSVFRNCCFYLNSCTFIGEEKSKLMRLTKISILLILLLVTMSCQCKKSTAETLSKSEGKMMEEGFKKATVVYSSLPGDCEYTFAVEGETNLFDPINLEGKFQKSQMNIWIKYIPLRMPNRCEKALPVEIAEIRIRQ